MTGKILSTAPAYYLEPFTDKCTVRVFINEITVSTSTVTASLLAGKFGVYLEFKFS